MSFTQQIFATLIGTVAGFIFALTLFFLKNWWETGQERKRLTKNLIRELDYDIALIEKGKMKLPKDWRKYQLGEKLIITLDTLVLAWYFYHRLST